MSWSPTPRDQVLAEVIAEADRRLDGQVPVDVAGVDRTFKDARVLADVLQVRWSATLAAHLDRALAELPGDAPRAVVRAWRRTARDLPGIRLVLDRRRTVAADRELERLLRRERRERQMLAVAAGLARPSRLPDDDAVEEGEKLEAAGRRYFDPHHRRPRPSLVQKIRAAVAV